MRYLIVTGQSGARKTACVHYLEDQGSFCMDNMPPMMLPKIIDAFSAAPIRHNTVTIAMDVRSGEFFDADAVAGMISELRKLGHRMDIIFLEASDETLLDRYKETRRDHPLTQEDIAKALHVSKQTVGSWENGKTSPTMDQAIRFCKLCDVPYDRVSFLRERNAI